MLSPLVNTVSENTLRDSKRQQRQWCLVPAANPMATFFDSFTLLQAWGHQSHSLGPSNGIQTTSLASLSDLQLLGRSAVISEDSRAFSIWWASKPP